MNGTRLTILAAIALTTLALAGCSEDRGSANAERDEATQSADALVGYVTTQNFDEEVLRSDIPVLVDFTAVWCLPCREVDPIIMSLYPEMYGRAKVFKLDIDEDPEIYQRLGINGVPHILFFNKGQELDRIVSPQPRETYIQYLEAIIDGRSTLDVSLQLIEEDAFRRHFTLSRSVEDLQRALERRADLLSSPLENGQSPLSMILNQPSVRQNDLIELALANGATPTTRDLVGLGRCNEFLAVLEDDPGAIDRADPDGATPLYLALARSNRLGADSCVSDVVDAGADPGAHLSQQHNLARMVVLSDDLELVNVLLDRGLDPIRGDASTGNTLVHWATMYRKLDLVRLLVERRVDVDMPNDKGETPETALRASMERMEAILETGVDPYGQAITPEYVRRIEENMVVNREMLGLLEG